MKFDWNRRSVEGFDPVREIKGWKQLAQAHPLEFFGLFVLAVELMVWWAVS